MEANILEIAKQCPHVCFTVQGGDLLAMGKSIVSDTMAKYRAEIEAKERAEKEEKMLSAQEAADVLGVSEKTLYRWRKAGYIEGIRVGGIIKYRRSDCRAILANGKPVENIAS
ncbi:MAG: helix-turn-helix domain-containing protein [Bacteroidales bacterium]|nr:helix-turn-helix domain-containing protein [Bacteroidales bacterium]